MSNALFTLVRTIFTFHTVHESDDMVKFGAQGCLCWRAQFSLSVLFLTVHGNDGAVKFSAQGCGR